MNYKMVYQASLLVALSAILYGSLGFFGTMAMHENIPMATMLVWRFIIAGIWILLFSLRKSIYQQIVTLNKRSLMLLFIMSVIGYTGSSLFYFMASEYTGTGLAMIIFFTYPMMVAVLSWLVYRHRFNITTISAMVLILMGLVLLEYSSNEVFSLQGILLGVLAAACYAFYLMGSKSPHVNTLSSNASTIIVCFSCALTSIIMAMATNALVLPQTLQSWLYLFGLGIFATAMPIQLMLEGLKHISSMRASIISVLEPLVTFFVGILCLSESVSLLQTIGAFVILGSALLVQFQREL